MAVHEPSLPRTLLFLRSSMQWFGGIGVIVLALSVFPQPATSTPDFLYQSEAREQKVRPSVVSTVRAISQIYLFNTLFAIVWLFIGAVILLPGYPWFEALWDAVNHGMTAISTGGFSVLDNSTAEYGSVSMEMWTLLPMFMGGISLPLYFVLYFSRSIREFVRDIQFRVYAVLLLLGTPTMIFFLRFTGSSPRPYYDGLFQFISALSTTGFQTSSIGDWAFPCVLFIVTMSMVVGGAAGATVGGIKLIRFYLVLRAMLWSVKESLIPEHALVNFDVGENSHTKQEAIQLFYRAGIFLLTYLLILLLAIISLSLIVPGQFSGGDIIFEATSAQSTVGLSSGLTSPSMAPSAEIILIFLMWIGRLEIIPVLLLAYTLICKPLPRIHP